MALLRPVFALALIASVAACGQSDLAEPPMPLGEFALGLNIAVADNVQMVPISRPTTPDDWEAVMIKAVDNRFGRYEGSKLYNIGISIDAYALAPPGIPVVAAPKSILVVTANIWDDAAQKKLNEEGKQITVFESLSGETVIGTGITRTKKQQMEALAYNAVHKVEEWLLENPQWFDMTEEEMAAAKAARLAAMRAAGKAPAGSEVAATADVGEGATRAAPSAN
ncbi:hypothetical protein Q9295_08430 [Xinfangfangia sp. CPCC 101601]|uniref:Lipoprotein n=1 Tax=Pseudogemmobacter lacusdianii TaxID=3069608 RepID=A0ABU0VXB0_9RHOB|nr:hypothetical protein [Xinfangfangia sp. CPCC 101601]MDQ2066396.1 hypothetical protein [Xinfangfangia sp. CPCC 101601]